MLRSLKRTTCVGIALFALVTNAAAQNLIGPVSDWPGMTNFINGQSATNYGMSFIIPPGAWGRYQNSLGLVSVTTNTFDLSPLAATINFGVPVYPLQVLQSDWTNGEPFTRSYVNATGGIVRTETSPPNYSATQWVVAVYQEPGAWETNKAAWFLDRSPSRQILTMTLISSDDVTNYFTTQSNEAAAAAANVNTNYVSTNSYPNTTLFVQSGSAVGGGGIGFYLHGPPDGPGTNGFSIYVTTNLMQPRGIGGGWSLAQRLSHLGDPVLFPWQDYGAGQGYFVAMPNIDTGTGLLAGDRQMLYGLDPFAANLIAGINDSVLLLNYGVTPDTAANPANFVAWKIANNFNPNAAIPDATWNGWSLSDLAARGINTNFDYVALGPSNAVIAYKSQHDHIVKVGWRQLDWDWNGTSNGVPRYFLGMTTTATFVEHTYVTGWDNFDFDSFTYTGTVGSGFRNFISASYLESETNGVVKPQSPYSNTTTRTGGMVASCSGGSNSFVTKLNGTVTSTNTFNGSIDISWDDWNWDSQWPANNTFALSSIMTVAATWQSITNSGTTNVDLYVPSTNTIVSSLNEQLFNEYFTTSMIYQAQTELNLCPSMSNLSWATGYKLSNSCGQSVGSASNTAMFYLSTRETVFDIGRMQYQISITNSATNVAYAATVAYVFTPYNTNGVLVTTNQVIIGVTNFLAKGNGGTIYLTPMDGITIEPPTNNGTIAVQMVTVAVVGDYNRDLTYKNDPHKSNPVSFAGPHGYVIMANTDDDDGDGIPDCDYDSGYHIHGTNDLSDIYELRDLNPEAGQI